MIEKFAQLRDVTEVSRAVMLLIQATMDEQCTIESRGTAPGETDMRLRFEGRDEHGFTVVVTLADPRDGQAPRRHSGSMFGGN